MTLNEGKGLDYSPIKQLCLYEYSSMFNLFVNIINLKKLPKCSILTGQKGLGKATFAYHLINYLFSQNEKYAYSVNNNCINQHNRSFNLVNSNTHPNFYLIDNKETEDSIKILQIRNLLKFLRNTTYENNLKVVLIDNVESLNLNAANALLKCLEEPSKNTFFILVQNSGDKIIDTIKSRCIEFKFFLKNSSKKKIFNSLYQQHSIDIENPDLFFESFYFDTPGNLINHLKSFENQQIDATHICISSIYFLIESFLKNGTLDTVSNISMFIEKFYNDLVQKNPSKSKKYFFNRVKILTSLKEMKNFNLNSKNVFLNIKDILEVDAR